ncbi:hypothetical protein E2C01_074284 [Portunus trituberculatus]|uniref:Uncharacterized protein n=1 Tax=Portunus trituberculatus TaxID=210409 RepID=A0A5B7I5A6_PORTR|nr:hypothetical protein [Portunus trituberculatus]
MDIRLFRYKTIFLKSVAEVHHHHHHHHQARTHAPLAPRLSCCNAAMPFAKCHREGHFALRRRLAAADTSPEHPSCPASGAPRQVVLLLGGKVGGKGRRGAVKRVCWWGGGSVFPSTYPVSWKPLKNDGDFRPGTLLAPASPRPPSCHRAKSAKKCGQAPRLRKSTEAPPPPPSGGLYWRRDWRKVSGGGDAPAALGSSLCRCLQQLT